jgi:NAD(P)-dependent dehydrogenase (short-subunit alcohol dehydrogenase family)
MDRKFSDSFVITGPTSGIGLRTALELAKRGTVVLVGRNQAKLDAVRARVGASGGHAICIGCDLGDLTSVDRAVAEILSLSLPITGLVNNAGVMPMRAEKPPAGLDQAFATNYLGAFLLTDRLIPHLPDAAHILFVTSAIEDPERKPAKVMGMRGGRFISIEASARGEWLGGGARLPGIDAYATSKQCMLAAALALAREVPRLRINAVEPGITPGTGLGGGNAAMHFLFGQIITRLPPFGRYRSTPERSAKVIAGIMTDRSAMTGRYFDEKGQLMTGSLLAQDPAFQERVVVETRVFLEAAARQIGQTVR